MKALNEWRKQNFLFVEAVIATLLAAIGLDLAHTFLRIDYLAGLLDGVRATLYGTASAGCATLLGFVITTATITDAVMQNPQWERFRRSHSYSQVQDIYFNTMRWLGASTLLFLIFLVIDTDTHRQLVCEAISVWLACIITVRVYRSIATLEKLLRMNSFKDKERLAA